MAGARARRRARWRALLALLCGLSGALQAAAAPEAPPDVLLITVDTLRADRLSGYGYRLPTSPALDALARRGVRFRNCSVQWPKTWPSMASLLTGAYPKTIGMKLRPRRMPESNLLLAEIFRQRGYRTGAVVANFNVGRQLGFDQGFDHFVESWQEAWRREAGDRPFANAPGKVKRYTDARTVGQQGLAWLRQGDAQQPFFLWLHYMDPHGPYLPPQAYRGHFEGRYPPEPVPLAALPAYQRQSRPGGDAPIDDLAHYRAQYDREIRYLDDELEGLLEAVEALGRQRSLLLAVTADHGESLGEHGYYLEHGLFPYQATAHVPLILVQEGRLPAGKRIDRPVGLIDLSPTLLELAGIPAPETFEGRSLVGLLDGEDESGGPEYVFLESGIREQTQLAVRHGRWKLVHVRSPEDRALMTGQEYELYDLESDPAEERNLAAQHPERVRRLAAVLSSWFEGGPRWARGQVVDPEALAPAEREMLRALGYLE